MKMLGRFRDYVLDFLGNSIVWIVFLVGLFGAYLAPATGPPGPTPTPMAYRTCQYCGGSYRVTCSGARCVFEGHDFIRLKMDERRQYETCALSWNRNADEIVKRMREIGHGRIIETATSLTVIPPVSSSGVK